MPTPDYIEIPLTQGQVVRVSAHRYEHLTQWKWYALRRPDRGMVDRKAIMLGYFTNPQKAHEAYCEASRKYHGEFGNTQ